jgi:lipopolysaccharide transport system ATP-binding protein
MRVRLAFAVAAHLEPEILLVDEVLAVGDVAFQKKCLGKMDDVAKEGRTVLFVSHNLGAVHSLCERALLLEEGQKKLDAPVEEVIGWYLFQTESSTGEVVWSPDDEDSPVSPEIRLKKVRLLNSRGLVQSTVGIQQPIQVCIEYDVLKLLPSIHVGIRLLSALGEVVFATTDEAAWPAQRPCGYYTSVCSIPGNFLNTGQYQIAVSAGIKGVRAFLPSRQVITFLVAETASSEKWPGIIRPDLAWEVRTNDKGVKSMDFGENEN